MTDDLVRDIEHVAFALKDVKEAIARYASFGFQMVQVEDVPGSIRSHLIRSGGAYIELLEALSPDSAVAQFIERRGEGLHHVCLRVDSLESATAAIGEAGCRLVSKEPMTDLRGQRSFVHPGSNGGVLMGLVEPYSAIREIVGGDDPAYDGKTYSPAVIARGDLLFVAGLNALDSQGSIQALGDIVGQAEIIYEKLGDLLSLAGAGPSNVVKTTDYIVSRDRYRDTAAVRRRFFGEDFPAATGVVVKELLGKGVLIEIEAVASL